MIIKVEIVGCVGSLRSELFDIGVIGSKSKIEYLIDKPNADVVYQAEELQKQLLELVDLAGGE